ncbi:MAG TPA: hypothetical protein VFK48_14680 [Usitatibacter sp.]|nr:hypothetical protein [Usitatibacter sp.]
MNLPDVKEQLTKLGFTYRENAPDEFDRQVRSEVERTATVARRAGIKLQ